MVGKWLIMEVGHKQDNYKQIRSKMTFLGLSRLDILKNELISCLVIL